MQAAVSVTEANSVCAASQSIGRSASILSGAMTALRLVPLPIHSALEMFVGLALMGLPFALGLSTAAIVVGIVVGALVVGTALQSLDTGGRPLPISAHVAADFGLGIGLAGAALVLLTMDAGASALFGAAAVAQLALTSVTRYSQR